MRPAAPRKLSQRARPWIPGTTRPPGGSSRLRARRPSVRRAIRRPTSPWRTAPPCRALPPAPKQPRTMPWLPRQAEGADHLAPGTRAWCSAPRSSFWVAAGPRSWPASLCWPGPARALHPRNPLLRFRLQGRGCYRYCKHPQLPAAEQRALRLAPATRWLESVPRKLARGWSAEWLLPALWAQVVCQRCGRGWLQRGRYPPVRW
mmetsp:Transcript_24813/g.78122  ORF Transcript_24813/g.78122 Transcript_24813/m.78122 type:complete len:204 (+) Transcript_24813:743-1354(+)